MVSIFVIFSWVARVFTDRRVLAVGRVSKRSDFNLLSKLAAYIIVLNISWLGVPDLAGWAMKLLKNSWFSLNICGMYLLMLLAVVFLASSKCVSDLFLMSLLVSILMTVLICGLLGRAWCHCSL